MFEQIMKPLAGIVTVFLVLLLIGPDFFPITNLDEAGMTVASLYLAEKYFGVKIV